MNIYSSKRKISFDSQISETFQNRMRYFSRWNYDARVGLKEEEKLFEKNYYPFQRIIPFFHSVTREKKFTRFQIASKQNRVS